MVAKKKRSSRRGKSSARRKRRSTKGRRRQNRSRGRWRLVLALVVLLRVVDRGQLHRFAPYCWIVGLVTLAVAGIS